MTDKSEMYVTEKAEEMSPTETSEAARGNWFTCEVVRAGTAAPGTIWIRLADVGGTFPPRWFSADGSVKNEILATALVAIANKLQVNVYLTSTDEGIGLVTNLYITREG